MNGLYFTYHKVQEEKPYIVIEKVDPQVKIVQIPAAIDGIVVRKLESYVFRKNRERMDMKKKRVLRYLSVGLLVTGMVFGGNQIQRVEGSVLKDIVGLFSGEPEEVRNLRNLELTAQSGEQLEYYFGLLSEEEQKIYREILLGIQNQDEKIYISSSIEEQIDRAYQAVLLDHAELFWLHNRGVVYKTLYSTYCELKPDEIYTDEEIAGGQQAAENAWNAVCAEIAEGSSDYEKARTVYRYLIQHTEYTFHDSDQNIKGVFQDGKAVCAGYARAAKYLLDRLGIPCIYVTGNSAAGVNSGGTTGHAWNLVKFDDAWYYMDVTNGDQPDFWNGIPNEEEFVLYDYLCPMPEDYERMSQADTEFEIPSCTQTAYNDALREGDVLETYSYEAAETLVQNKIQQGYQKIRLKFNTDEDFQQAINDLFSQGMLQDLASYYINYYNLSELQYHYGMLEELKTIYIIF